MKQVQDSIAGVRYQYQSTVGQPATELEDYLARPIGGLGVRPSFW